MAVNVLRGENPVLVTLYPPQIPYVPVWDRTWTFAVQSPEQIFDIDTWWIKLHQRCSTNTCVCQDLRLSWHRTLRAAPCAVRTCTASGRRPCNSKEPRRAVDNRQRYCTKQQHVTILCCNLKVILRPQSSEWSEHVMATCWWRLSLSAKHFVLPLTITNLLGAAGCFLLSKHKGQ